MIFNQSECRYRGQMLLKCAISKVKLNGFSIRVQLLLLPINYGGKNKLKYNHGMQFKQNTNYKGVLVQSVVVFLFNFYDCKPFKLFINANKSMHCDHILRIKWNGMEINHNKWLQCWTSYVRIKCYFWPRFFFKFGWRRQNI